MNLATVFEADSAVGLLDEAMGVASSAVVGSTAKAMVEWQLDPVGWAEKYLGVPRETLRWSESPEYDGHVWDQTKDPISLMLEASARGQDVGIEAGTGTGKSFALAIAVLHKLACWEDSRVFTYAPKEDQLRLFMWAEISHLWPNFQELFPDAEKTDLRIRMRPGADKWGAKGYAVQIRAGENSATGAQGAHAEHMLTIVEEGPGVQSPVWTALDNTRTADGNHQIAVGNPDGVTDPLHLWCNRPGVLHITASAYDAPNVVTGRNVIPGGVSRKKVEERRHTYKNNKALFDSRVRGIAPAKKLGLALRFDRRRNTQQFEPELGGKLALHKGWRWYAGMDFGAWRSSFLLGCVDHLGRLFIVDELFWGFGTSIEERGVAIVEALERWSVPRSKFTWVGDSANATDIIELNRVMRVKLKKKWRVSAVKKVAGGTVRGYRETGVEKINQLLDHSELLIRRGLGAELEWKAGASTTADGVEKTGSRLLWEISEWAYPDPTRLTDAQKQDPDDNSADGADAIAALRYLVMTWLAKAPRPPKDERHEPNRDKSLEKLQKQLRKLHQQRG